MLLEAKTDYWTTPAGLAIRMRMIGEDFTFNLVNNSLQAYGNKNKVKGWEWIGNLDELVCAYCEPRIGNFYRLGQFLPRLPAHIHCRCEFQLIPK